MRFCALAALIALGGCRSDPLCGARNAADLAPTESRYRAMSAAERRQDADTFNALARRCGWEP